MDLAYEKNDLESLLISAASFISKSPLALFTASVALLSNFRYCSWSSAVPVCLYLFRVLVFFLVAFLAFLFIHTLLLLLVFFLVGMPLQALSRMVVNVSSFSSVVALSVIHSSHSSRPSTFRIPSQSALL